MMLLDRVDRAFFPRGQRRKIERLARREPASGGRHATHGLFRSLAEATVRQGYAEAIDYTTVREILYAAKLRLPLFCFWKTTVWDDEAIARALKILWYYERIESLWQRGEVLLAADEKPNLQVLERVYPKQPSGSWCSRPKLVEHIIESRQEYNQWYAHPFDWQWTCRDSRYWLNNTPGLIRCKT
jgi:hypothetical protein